jgi:hypothetical protein
MDDDDAIVVKGKSRGIDHAEGPFDSRDAWLAQGILPGRWLAMS